ncbi:MAG: phosphopantetheine-binding protein [Burkholderiales bacterium]|nr:phosphopantetheine-binding protein [Burkholderiales bacterium]
MDNIRKQKIRDFFLETLKQQSDDQSLADNDSLFVSGRLDSFSMMMFVMYLEKEFAIDFAALDFDVNLIDSLNEIELFIDSQVSV